MDSEAIKDLLTNVTPGPWAWEENHPLNACATVTAKADAGWTIGIATLYGCSDGVPNPSAPDEPWGDHPIRRADARFIAAARELVPALLAERDAALAEVARLSTPPDEAEVLLRTLRSHRGLNALQMWAMRDQAADAITRLSHALAAETAKREAMEAVLRYYKDQFCEGFCDDMPSLEYTDADCERDCGGCKARATLAKHGSKT